MWEEHGATDFQHDTSPVVVAHGAFQEAQQRVARDQTSDQQTRVVDGHESLEPGWAWGQERPVGRHAHAGEGAEERVEQRAEEQQRRRVGVVRAVLHQHGHHVPQHSHHAQAGQDDVCGLVSDGVI